MVVRFGRDWWGTGPAAILLFLAYASATNAQQGKVPDKAPPAAPAEPAAPAQAPPKAPAWSVNCTNAGEGLACKAVQTIVLAQTRQLLLSISVSKSAADKSAALLLHLPHGLYIPARVTMSVDGGSLETLEIQTCDAKGCYAGAQVTAEKLGAMSKGEKLNIVFQDLKKQRITVPVPLKGFEDAYKKL